MGEGGDFFLFYFNKSSYHGCAKKGEREVGKKGGPIHT